METIVADEGEEKPVAVSGTAHRFFTGEDRKALLKSIVPCREACVRVLIEVPIGELPYLVPQRLVAPMNEAATELGASRQESTLNGITME